MGSICAYIDTYIHPLWVSKATGCSREERAYSQKFNVSCVDALLLISTIYVYMLRSSVFLFIIKYVFVFPVFIFLDLPIKRVGCVNNYKLYQSHIKIILSCSSQVLCVCMSTHAHINIYRHKYKIYTHLEELEIYDSLDIL